MNPPRRLLWQTLYTWVLHPLLVAGLYATSLRSGKIRRSLRGRRGLWARLRSQLAAREPGRPLVWVHVSSAGEFLQALPVMERLMDDGAQCALTLSSVSALRWTGERRAGLPRLVAADYLPLDFRANARHMLELLRPAALVYCKYDLWPNLVWEAQRAGVPQFLVSATLHERSRRYTSAIGRSLYRSLYGALEGIFAVTDADRERFLHTCPGHPGVEVLGDTRFDSVLARKRTLAPPPMPASVREGTVLVVGSSWPQDEAHLLPVLREALEAFPELVLLLVPHEIHEEHLGQIEAAFAGQALVRYTRMAPEDPARVRIVVVDAVGLLSALYAYGTLAYVGGAFSTGVHNVLEPAAMGLPPVFGPFHQNSPEALSLAHLGCAFAVQDGAGMRQVLFRLLSDLPGTRKLGQAAAAFVQEHAGAAERCFERIRTRLA